MKKGSVAHQIIGSFEDIGKSILEETGKVPGELVKTALEGNVASVAPQEGQAVVYGEGKPESRPTGGETLKKLTEADINQIVARKALLEISGSGRSQPEPTVYEEKQKEADAAKQYELNLKEAQNLVLKPVSTKPKRENRNGVSSKQTRVEKKLTGAD